MPTFQIHELMNQYFLLLLLLLMPESILVVLQKLMILIFKAFQFQFNLWEGHMPKLPSAR